MVLLQFPAIDTEEELGKKKSILSFMLFQATWLKKSYILEDIKQHLIDG